jgi:hypothetical protein
MLLKVHLQVYKNGQKNLSNSLLVQVNLLKFSKKYVCKYKKLIIGAILRSFFWPASLARGFVMFGNNESVICKYIKNQLSPLYWKIFHPH